MQIPHPPKLAYTPSSASLQPVLLLGSPLSREGTGVAGDAMSSEPCVGSGVPECHWVLGEA